MKTIICVSFLALFLFSTANASATVDIIFGVIKGTVSPLQVKSLNDPTGCYIQWQGMHKAVSDLVDAIMNQGSAVIIISDLINAITNLVYVQQYCILHDVDDDLEHFAKHPGDLIGRLVWNYKLSVSFVKDIINGLRTQNYEIIGNGLGAIIYVIFDGQIL